ncbi:MAG: hypothetical protein EB078_10775 [Proteobacteria bacterium]|nr:hypothetical protein [Pseudomonadota bacterium]NDC24392.1 hypothetical protein [Pseudomonadota bacterium]NDD05380.1 hypothetical protein [Pseudomonadota bacterium]NDG27939.1 hypothetical protein [Pseudomonadota bacterium]
MPKAALTELSFFLPVTAELFSNKRKVLPKTGEKVMELRQLSDRSVRELSLGPILMRCVSRRK